MPDCPNWCLVLETVIFVPPIVAACSWSRLTGYEPSQESGHLSAVPFGRADETSELLALRVYQERGGQAEHAQAAGGLAAGIEISGEMRDPHLAKERVDRFPAAAVDRERHHLEPRPTELRL